MANLKAIGMVMGLSVCFTVLRAQYLEATTANPDPNKRVDVDIRAFFTRDSAQGSPYLVRGWLQGTIDLTSQRRLPEPGHRLLFNYDKLNERVYFTDGTRVWFYPNDSISNFTFVTDRQAL
jgi:hypothetical protein